MYLYYTTSAGENEEQYMPQASLGGFKSSTPVKNDDYDNLFGEISSLTVNQNRDQYIALVLENETGADVTNVEAWFEVNEGSYSSYQIAAVDMAENSDGVMKMERTREIYNKPFNGTFVEADVDNKALIGDMLDGEKIGIWLRRSLLVDVIDTDQELFYEVDPNNTKMYRKIELSQTDTMTLHISWD